jgi:EAL domain-containing protein (putative c-di-GMP-specific phosphodiesterase class I)
LAESTGLIVPLGRRVLERACLQATEWLAAGFDIEVSVNVSGRQLREDSFVDDFEAVLTRSQLDAARVLVEITESVLVADEVTTSAVRELHDIGCPIAMDDFGTGYSSLAGLRDLPLDVLKIDRAFITDLGLSSRANATVEAIIGVARALDLVVVAEGVETPQQLEVLDGMGCQRVQGFLVATPSAAEEAEELLSGGWQSSSDRSGSLH